MLDGHPFNFPLFELYCAPIYAPIAHHFFHERAQTFIKFQVTTSSKNEVFLHF